MCVGIVADGSGAAEATHKPVSSSTPTTSAAIVPQRGVSVNGFSSGRCLAGRPAMAPALTQAPTPHQRCCPPPSNSHKLLLVNKSGLKTTSDVEEQLVWPSSQCCGDGGGGSGGLKSHSRSTNRNNKKKTILSDREIARSDEVHKSRGTADSSGNSGGGIPGQQALDNHHPPPVKSPGPDHSRDCEVETVAPPRPPTNGGGTTTPPPPISRTSLNGTSTIPTTMGLQPTSPGDRMDLDSSPLQAPKTDWSTTTIPDPSNPTSLEEDGIVSTHIGEGEEEEHSVEDVILDVIKSMEAGDHQPSCLGLSEAEQQLLRDAVAFLPETSSSNSSSNVSAPSTTNAIVFDKAAEVERRLAEARSKQQAIEARCQSLLRKAGRLQSRHVSRHVADQVSNFVAFARDTLSLGGTSGGRHAGGPGTANLYGWAEDGRLPTREEVRNIPTATLVNLVSRLQAPPVSYLSNRRYFGLPSKSSGSQQQQHHAARHQQLSSQVAETLEEVAGLWEAQLRYLQRCDDPDATESSSGGESEDDTPAHLQAGAELGLNDPTNLESTPTPIKPVSTYQRAAWKWARDRAAVAARWSWLQAQVSDLEYRIRQHTDVYRQLRAAKGPLHFNSPSANGFTTNSPVKEEDIGNGEAVGCSSSSSRTRSLVTNSNGNVGFRHRRLIRASQHGAGSGRRPTRGSHGSTVRCCCVMSRIYHPCVLCNGKNNYLLPVDPDGMTLGERIGLTDRGFHPVLSMPQDMPLGAHVDSLLKSGDWRPPPPPSSVINNNSGGTTSAPSKALRRSISKVGDEEGGSAKRRVNSSFIPKRKKLVDGSGLNDEGKSERRRALLKRRKRAGLSADAMDEDSGSFPSSPYAGDISTSGRNDRPGHRSSILHDIMRRRTSYDIDNIVIPYSMAATTRVERLQYKEIQTPKWRTIDDDEEVAVESTEEVEDVSEEACLGRHERSEVEERRKFMTYLKQPAGLTRGRRRVDHINLMIDTGRADQSSGANTPDQPMSPAPPDSAGPIFGPKTSLDETESLLEGQDGGFGGDVTTDSSTFVAAAIKERRRTASLSKKDSSWKFSIGDDNSAMSWDVDEQIRNVVPYEPRQFPLPDNVYDVMMEEMPPEDMDEDSTAISGKQDTVALAVDAVVAAAAGETSGTNYPGNIIEDQSRTVSPVTFLSESAGSLSPHDGEEDLEVDELDDPNDPEWEGSQGSAPRSRKR